MADDGPVQAQDWRTSVRTGGVQKAPKLVNVKLATTPESLRIMRARAAGGDGGGPGLS